MKVPRKWMVLAGIGLLAILVFAIRAGHADQLQHFTARVERGDIRDAVEATGTVNAVITVQVGSQVSGTIAKLNADFNSRVHQGDVVAVIEPSLFKGALLQASADLENSKANLTAAEANLARARANLVQARADYDRNVTLAKDDIVTQQQLDLVRAANEAAKASVDVAQAGITQARAQMDQKAAAESVARINLDHTVIRSPIDGIVVARNVDIGQTVAASLQAPTLFTIAQDLTKMRVYAKTDESDVGSITVGQMITFKVDAFPKETFHGELTQIRMNPTTVQNVVTYDAVIDFQNPAMRLFPGMTAYVTIPIASAHDVLKLPNAALRYKPPLDPDRVRELYQQYHVDGGEQPATPGAPATQTQAPRSARAESAIVWKRHSDNTLEPVKVALGITDHAFTEVTSVITGQLKEGDELVTRTMAVNGPAPAGQAAAVRR